MKKMLLVTAIGIFLILSGIQAVALKSDANTQPGNTQGRNTFTHTVFTEFFSTTSCGHCPYVHMALKNIYYGGWYPFYYTSMCLYHNTHADARGTEDNVQYVPDTFFDGGYQVICGSNDNVQQDMSACNTSITQCSARTVPDIKTTLNVNWLGNATMDIQASVQNNNSTAPYSGHIRVYVCEVVSSMGWKDAQNHLYTFPFLDYAFNEAIGINPSSTWSDEITWDGHNYNDGYGHNFGSIQYGNIMIIAAVFNATGYLAYSYPPNQCPFTAYNVDDATGFMVGGTGPNPPSSPDPKDGATGVDIHKQLGWTGGGAPGTTITYDVYFGTTNPPLLVVHNQSTTTYNPGIMNYLTTYYWKIVAWDQNANISQGPIWHFTTLQNPNQPPSAPTITGPAKGKPGNMYKFTFTTTDPDANDMVYVLVDWGDNTTSDWVGPHTSGSPFIINHEWTTKGTYTVKAKAKDDHGAESDWATLPVKMPASYGMSNPFLHWLLERFPNAFPFLRYLIGE